MPQKDCAEPATMSTSTAWCRRRPARGRTLQATAIRERLQRCSGRPGVCRLLRRLSRTKVGHWRAEEPQTDRDAGARAQTGRPKSRLDDDRVDTAPPVRDNPGAILNSRRQIPARLSQLRNCRRGAASRRITADNRRMKARANHVARPSRLCGAERGSGTGGRSGAGPIIGNGARRSHDNGTCPVLDLIIGLIPFCYPRVLS